jgi:hypothetical protein
MLASPAHYFRALSKPVQDVLLLRIAAFDEPDPHKSHQMHLQVKETFKEIPEYDPDAEYFHTGAPVDRDMEFLQISYIYMPKHPLIRLLIGKFNDGDPRYLDAACGNNIIDDYVLPNDAVNTLAQLGFPYAIVRSYRCGKIPLRKYLPCMDSGILCAYACSSILNLIYVFKIVRTYDARILVIVCNQVHDGLQYDEQIIPMLNNNQSSCDTVENRVGYDRGTCAYIMTLMIGYSLSREYISASGVDNVFGKFITASHALIVYNTYVAVFKSRVNAWLLCARRFGISKDIRAIIGKLIYEQMYM